MALPLDLPPKERRRRDWRPIVTASLVAFCASLTVMLPVLLTVQAANRDLSHELVQGARAKARGSQIVACRGGNIVRGFARIAAAEHAELAYELFPLRDCEATYDQGRPVFLPPVIERQYMEAIREGRPALYHGGKLIPDDGQLGVRP